MTDKTQEPVAWMDSNDDVFFTEEDAHRTGIAPIHPLYTSPPASKPWVGLTDEEIQTIWRNSEHMTVNQVCRAIEAKLKEKNI